MSPTSPPERRSGSAENAGQLPASGAGFDELWARVERSVADERGVKAWLQSRPTGLRVALVCGLFAALACLHFLWARRSDWSLHPGERLLLVVGAALVAIVFCLRLVLAPLTRPFRAPLALASMTLLLVPVLSALVPDLRFGAGDTHAGAAALGAAAGCFVYGSVLVLGVGAALWCVDRGAPIGAARLVPAVVCAGLVAHLILQIHCANDNPTHLLLGHASIGIAWLVVLSALYARSLGRRSR
jgi:hypothetical protein